MKKGGEDLLARFQESSERMKGHVHILEYRVPVEEQMAYFKYSQVLRRKNDPPRPFSEEACEEILRSKVLNKEATLSQRRLGITLLGTSRSIRGYRLLEEYVRDPDPQLAGWAHVALMEARLALESEFSDEKQIYISTGLGGKAGKLRFFALLVAKGKQPFREYQRQTIEQEFAYALEQNGCEIERLTIGEYHVELLLLVPYQLKVNSILDQAVNACNEFGEFLAARYALTNVKELTEEEVNEVLDKYEDD